MRFGYDEKFISHCLFDLSTIQYTHKLEMEKIETFVSWSHFTKKEKKGLYSRMTHLRLTDIIFVFEQQTGTGTLANRMLRSFYLNFMTFFCCCSGIIFFKYRSRISTESQFFSILL